MKIVPPQRKSVHGMHANVPCEYRPSVSWDRLAASVPAPREEAAVTSQGHPYSVFKRAVQRRNVAAALAAAHDLPQLTLLDALDLTMLVARKDAARYPRLAARWLGRWLEEHPAPTIEEAALAASSLAALPGAGYAEAATTLKSMAETAARRRRETGVG